MKKQNLPKKRVQKEISAENREIKAKICQLGRNFCLGPLIEILKLKGFLKASWILTQYCEIRICSWASEKWLRIGSIHF